MSYTAAIDGLMSLAGELHATPGGPRRKFNLNQMRTLMKALGDPQNTFPSILIAGTNGKGSTAATLASILHEAGYRTGLYTSPHLERVNERIQCGREAIHDDRLAAIYFHIEATARGLVNAGQLPAMPSFFEAMTAIAFVAFSEMPVDIAVLEVGMGGRLDATNIVEPLLSIITDISLDHTEWLGPTIRDIAREKAGILRPNGTLITLSQHPEANQVIGEEAARLSVRGVNAAEYMPGRNASQSPFRNQYPLMVSEQVITVDSPLAGQHQQRNIALAIAAAVELEKKESDSSQKMDMVQSMGYNILPNAIQSGIFHTNWPGRLEFVSGRGNHPDILLDVAHNPAGAWALRSAINALDLDRYSQATKTLIFGCLEDKAIEEMAGILFPLFDRVIVTPVRSPRSAKPNTVLHAASLTGQIAAVAENASAALDQAITESTVDGLVVVSGSVYLVGEVRHRASQT